MAGTSELRHGDPLHEHGLVVTRLVRQRAGIPYEIERQTCPACRRVLDERPLRRAAA